MKKTADSFSRRETPELQSSIRRRPGFPCLSAGKTAHRKVTRQRPALSAPRIVPNATTAADKSYSEAARSSAFRPLFSTPAFRPNASKNRRLSILNFRRSSAKGVREGIRYGGGAPKTPRLENPSKIRCNEIFTARSGMHETSNYSPAKRSRRRIPVYGRVPNPQAFQGINR